MAGRAESILKEVSPRFEIVQAEPPAALDGIGPGALGVAYKGHPKDGYNHSVLCGNVKALLEGMS